MTCEELSQEYTAFALGVAGEAERDAITEHLTRKCPLCTPGIVSALATVSAMSGAVKEVEPPKRLRARVVAMVRPELFQPEFSASAHETGKSARLSAPRRRWFTTALPWGLAAALAVVLLVSVMIPRNAADKSHIDALSILKDPAVRDVSFGPSAHGHVFVSPERGVVFIGANLPKIAGNRTFELWVIPAGGNPIPAGTFRASGDDTAVYVRQGRVESGAAAVAVTVEPEGGSPQPTTKPFIVAPLG